jgi:hypothetical protein
MRQFVIHSLAAAAIGACSRFQSRRHSQRPSPSATRNMLPTRPLSERRSRPRRTSSQPAVRGQRPFRRSPPLRLPPRDINSPPHLRPLHSPPRRKSALPEPDSSRPMRKRAPAAHRIPLFGSTRSQTSTTSRDGATPATRSRAPICALEGRAYGPTGVGKCDRCADLLEVQGSKPDRIQFRLLASDASSRSGAGGRATPGVGFRSSTTASKNTSSNSPGSRSRVAANSH